MELSKTPKEIREEKRLQKLEERLERIHFLRGLENDYDIRGYVYKIRTNGRRDTCAPVDSVLDDHDFGIQYGPGLYEVIYVVKDLDEKETRKCVSYSIHSSYKALHKSWCIENGIEFIDESFTQAAAPAAGPRFDFSRLMTPEGATAILGAVEALKRLFSGGQSDLLRDLLNQQNKVIESALSGSKKENALENKIMAAAVDRMLAPAKSGFEEMRGQIDMLKELGLATGLIQESTDEKGPGAAILEKALEHLPALLERFANNPVHAGRALIREQPGARILLASKKNQAAAIAAVQARHGSQVAQGLAQGAGIKPSVISNALKTPPKDIPKIETENGVLSL